MDSPCLEQVREVGISQIFPCLWRHGKIDGSTAVAIWSRSEAGCQDGPQVDKFHTIYTHKMYCIYCIYYNYTIHSVYTWYRNIYIYIISTISSWLKDWRDHSVSWIFQLRQRSLHACGLVWWYTVTRRPFCGGDGDGFGRHSGFGARRRRRRRLSGGGDGLFRYQHRVPKSPQQFLRHHMEVLIISRQPAS